MPSGAPARCRLLVAALCACVVMLSTGSGSRAKAGADLELGRYLATSCMTCHRSATDTSTIPNIFGIDQQHLILVMKAYRDKVLPNPVMQSIASSLSDEDIAALALFFWTTKKP